MSSSGDQHDSLDEDDDNDFGSDGIPDSFFMAEEDSVDEWGSFDDDDSLDENDDGKKSVLFPYALVALICLLGIGLFALLNDLRLNKTPASSQPTDTKLLKGTP